MRLARPERASRQAALRAAPARRLAQDRLNQLRGCFAARSAKRRACLSSTTSPSALPAARCWKTPSARITPGARVGLVGRNGTGKTTLFNVITGDISPEHGSVEMPPRWRIGRLAQEAPNGPESLLEVVLKADVERSAAAGRGRDRARPASHRRDPDPARRYRRARGACARRLDPVGPRLFHRRPGAALLGILRRLAHARRARRHAVRRARPAAARRADQLSRSRRHAVAAGSSGALSAHHDRSSATTATCSTTRSTRSCRWKPRSSRSIAAAIPTSNACAASA